MTDVVRHGTRRFDAFFPKPVSPDHAVLCKPVEASVVIGEAHSLLERGERSQNGDP